MKNSKFTIPLASMTTPFGLVLLLTVLAFILSLFFGKGNASGDTFQQSLMLFRFWQDGFFGLLGFTLQMIMILVFGYALAIFEPVNHFLRRISKIPNQLMSGASLTASLTMISGLLNWGFGLIVGALLARFVHDALLEKKKASNLPLLAASGYLGMAIWHGGFSGSAPLTVAGSGHFLEETVGLIPVTETLFSSFNLLITPGLFLIFLITVFLISRKVGRVSEETYFSIPLTPIKPGSEDFLAGVSGIFMILVLLAGVYFGSENVLSMISLNWVNFLLFALTLLAFRSWNQFSFAVKEGLKSSSDILVQFPFYAGIVGLLSSSGALFEISTGIQSRTGENIFPLVTFFSTSLVNLLVPSGGGQWAIQGPVIMEAAEIWGMNLSKLVMIFSYGDQISNLLQPFWALPLLSITGVPVRKIFPYCFILFLSGFVFLSLAIWFLY